MDHYFTRNPNSELKKKIIKILINNKKLILTTASGLFSYGKIDIGTKILLKYLRFDNINSFLDLGCGYGIVGIYASFFTDNVTMIDINKRAIKISEINSKLNKINPEIIESDGFSDINKNRNFDLIATNPPNHAGKSLIQEWIKNSYSHLNNKGYFYMVCKTRLGAKSYINFAENIFNNVELIKIKSGYRVFRTQKRETNN